MNHAEEDEREFETALLAEMPLAGDSSRVTDQEGRMKQDRYRDPMHGDDTCDRKEADLTESANLPSDSGASYRRYQS